MTLHWKTAALGHVALVIAGQSPDGSSYNTSGKGLPFYQGKKEFQERFIGAPTTWTTNPTKLAVAGDILMSVRAPVGPINLATQQCCIGRGLAAIRNMNGLNRDFLYYYLLSKQEEICGIAGAIFPSISKTDIEKIPLAYPPEAEQRRIVGILDKAFAAIATAKANTERNLQNVRALFENNLNSIFARSWATCQLVKLADLATDITDGDHLPPPKSAEGVPFITIGNIDKETKKIDFSDTFMVPRSYFEGLKPNRRPQKGDVLYTVTGSFGIPVLVDNGTEFCFQRHIGLVRPKPETMSRWLYYLLLSPQVSEQADEGATGAAQRTVSLQLLRNFSVPRVEPSHQSSEVARLDETSRETERLEGCYRSKLNALGELKRSLLQRAFAGNL